MNNKQLSPGEVVLLVAGVVALIASFLPWIDAFGVSRSSWSGDVLMPVSTFVPLSAVVAAAVFALGKFTSVSLPTNVLGFTTEQIVKIFALAGALLAIGWIVAIENAGIGFWLSALSTFGAVAGVLMIEKDAGTRTIV